MTKKFLLFIGDIAIFYLSLALTLYIRYGADYGSQIQNHLFPFSITFVIWIMTFYILNLYEFVILKNNQDFYNTLLKGIFIGAGLAIAFFYLTPLFEITPKRNLFIFIAILTILLVFWRRAFNNLILATTFKNNTIIVGFNQQSLELAKYLTQHPQFGYQLKYILDTKTNSAYSFEDIDFKQVNGAQDIEKILKEKNINTVILSPEAYQIKEILDVFYKAISRRIQFFNLSSFYERMTGRVPLSAINQIWFLENITGVKKIYEFGKRIFDILFGILLGGLTLVLFMPIAVVIRLSSPGPVLYNQERVGQGGKIFKIKKFRTMIKNAEENGAVWTQPNDPRITKFGKFLRKTRLDELPQVINILKGEMSFVGPRAERPEFHEKLKKEMPFYEERYLIKPGATGWAQLQKDYYSSISDTKEKLQYDLFYIKNRSFALDLSIILKTIYIVLRGGGR